MLYCRNLPKNLALTANNGRKFELLSFGAVGGETICYRPASSSGPVFVIWDTAAANAVVTSFSSFGARTFGDNYLTTGSSSSGAEAGASLGVGSAAAAGPDRHFLGSFKHLIGPAFFTNLPAIMLSLPEEGRHAVTKGPTFSIIGPAADLAVQFLECLAAAQK